MITKNFELNESFFDGINPIEANRLKIFLKDVDNKFRVAIIDIEKTSDADPVFVGLYMSKEISSISKTINRPDFTRIGISSEELNDLIEYIAQEALSDYYRQFQKTDEQILKEIINEETTDTIKFIKENEISGLQANLFIIQTIESIKVRIGYRDLNLSEEQIDRIIENEFDKLQI